MSRAVIPLTDFFNDGPWYVLSSGSLGGSNLSPEQISNALLSEDEAIIHQLLRDGICLPIIFPGDCALDNAIVIIGDLTKQEDAEWIGRLRSKLEIPCGDFFIMGGCMEEEFEAVLNQSDFDDEIFQKVKLTPGSYLVEVYAYVSSLTVNFALDDIYAEEGEDSIQSCWKRTRPGKDYPEWLKLYLEEDYIPEGTGLVEYIIRLAPSTTEVLLPKLEDESKWCEGFELRRPELSPLGISRTSLIG